jgi:excisionase family DNA binding protein
MNNLAERASKEPTASPRFLSAPAVAHLLGIDHSKVLRWIASGELPAIDVSQNHGGRPRWRVDPADLDSFLLRRRTRSAPAAGPRRQRMPNRIVEYF